MGTLMKWVGGLWALFGVYVLFSIAADRDNPNTVSDAESGAFILAVVLMILPGLVVYGLGARIKKANAVDRSLRACPFCAEMIKPEARVCRYCQRELSPTEKTPS